MPKINASQLKKIPLGVWTLGGVSLLMDSSSEMIHSLLPLFVVMTLGASAFTLGIMEGVAEATALIIKVFSGVLSDFLGRRKLIVLFGYSIAALTKPVFALANSTALVFGARFADRVGKGVRGAPRDALLADITPPAIRGAAFGLRQALDTVGAVLGPLIATGLMVLWANDFRAIFWVAVIPAVLAVLLIIFGVKEPASKPHVKPKFPISAHNLKRLGHSYWWLVVIGSAFALARFSEAFLVLRAQQNGVPTAMVPLVLVVMNIVYSTAAYPFGKLSDKLAHNVLLKLGIIVLIGAHLALAVSSGWILVLVGVTLWGIHLALTQGLFARMIADVAPADLRGTAYGFFNLTSGVAMLVSSALAGLLWDKLGAAFTFWAGIVFSFFALMGLLVQPKMRRH